MIITSFRVACADSQSGQTAVSDCRLNLTLVFPYPEAAAASIDQTDSIQGAHVKSVTFGI